MNKMKQRQLFLLLLLYLFGFNVSAQTNADSLYLIFCKDTGVNTKSAMAVAKSHFNYGVHLDEKGNAPQAIAYIEKALEVFIENKHDSLIAKAANYLGSVYWIEGDCPASTHNYETALKSAKNRKDSVMIALIKMNLSGNYSTSGRNEKAIQFAISALEYKEKKKGLKNICYDYITVAEIFESIENIKKWKEYVSKAYKLKDTEQCTSATDKVMIYNNLGRIAEYEKKYDKALVYYDTVMQISRPIEYNQGIGLALLNSALILQSQKKFPQALDYATKSEQYFNNVPYYIMAIINTKAQLMQDIGKHTKALALLENNIKNKNIALYPSMKQECLSLLYELNFHLQNYQEAYYWNNALMTYSDSLKNQENRKIITELETKYESEKKEQQIALLFSENQIKNQRIILFVSISISLLIILSLGILLAFRIKKQNTLKQETLRQKLLRSQMNPHFIFNALGSIQSYMLNNNTKEAAAYLSNFASLTRAILNHSSAEAVLLEQETEALHNYIKLEQMRLQGSFEYSIAFNNMDDAEFIRIPPMLIQPFVENAIKHGIRNKKNGKLNIVINDNGNTLGVSVNDNGVGFDANTSGSKTHKSMAMIIFDQRIKLLKNKYTKGASATIDSQKGKGTTVKIIIPIIN